MLYQDSYALAAINNDSEHQNISVVVKKAELAYKQGSIRKRWIKGK